MMSAVPRYRRAREICGLSIAQAARLLSIGACDLANMEINAADPILRATSEMERRMADLYGCALAWLQGGDVTMPYETWQLLRDDRLTFAEQRRLAEVIGSLPSKAGT